MKITVHASRGPVTITSENQIAYLVDAVASRLVEKVSMFDEDEQAPTWHFDEDDEFDANLLKAIGGENFSDIYEPILKSIAADREAEGRE